MVLKLLFPMLTFFADVWLPNKAKPFLFKCEQICAGPVSFEIIKLALLIKLIRIFKLTGSLLSKTTLAFNSYAS